MYSLPPPTRGAASPAADPSTPGRDFPLPSPISGHSGLSVLQELPGVGPVERVGGSGLREHQAWGVVVCATWGVDFPSLEAHPAPHSRVPTPTGGTAGSGWLWPGCPARWAEGGRADRKGLGMGNTVGKHPVAFLPAWGYKEGARPVPGLRNGTRNLFPTSHEALRDLRAALYHFFIIHSLIHSPTNIDGQPTTCEARP